MCVLLKFEIESQELLPNGLNILFLNHFETNRAWKWTCLIGLQFVLIGLWNVKVLTFGDDDLKGEKKRKRKMSKAILSSKKKNSIVDKSFMRKLLEKSP